MKFTLPLLCLCAFLFAGCAPRVISQSNQQTPYFRPPTEAPITQPALPSSTAENITQPEVQAPTPTPDCQDNLTFLEDLSIPDGSVVAPQTTLDKRWSVENSGSCNWDERYRVRLVAGQALGAPEEQSLYPARSGSQAILRMLFQAPDEPGAYRSAWQAISPQGEPFGDPFFIDIQVAP